MIRIGTPVNPEAYQTIRRYVSNRPVNIEAMIRDLGIELDKNADLDELIAGQIQRLPDGEYRISVNRNDHYFRKRFTMAHELGHYIYHKDLIGAGIDDDRLYRSTSAGDFYNTRIEQRHETEANKFAASILMPKPLVQRDWEELRNLRTVATLWQVSPQALRIRLELEPELETNEHL